MVNMQSLLINSSLKSRNYITNLKISSLIINSPKDKGGNTKHFIKKIKHS